MENLIKPVENLGHCKLWNNLHSIKLFLSRSLPGSGAYGFAPYGFGAYGFGAYGFGPYGFGAYVFGAYGF